MVTGNREPGVASSLHRGGVDRVDGLVGETGSHCLGLTPAEFGEGRVDALGERHVRDEPLFSMANQQDLADAIE